jgi:adenylate cyclase
MTLTRRIRVKIASWLIVVLFSGLMGAVYSRLVYPEGSLNPGDWKVGAITGIVIALISIGTEIFSRDLRFMIWVRGLRQGVNWIVRSAMHFAVILAALLGTQYLFDRFVYGRPAFSTISVGETSTDAAFCVIVLVAVVFILEMKSLLGGRVIANTLLGNYSAPTVKHRIFLLVDMVGSSEAATQLGDQRFHGFLSDVFRIVEGSVENNGGEIYTFIGDALIASWPLGEKPKNAGVVNACIAMLGGLEAAGANFYGRYGIEPRIRMVMHGGPVVLGQYGETRRQVTYLGEVLNVTSRMERFAKQTGYEMLVSRELLMKLPLPEGVAVAPIPVATLDRWQGNIELLALQRAFAASHLPTFPGKKRPPEPTLKAVK